MPKYYVIDDHKNKHESYTKEQYLALLAQAIEDGDLENIDADDAFITKLKSIVDGGTYYIAFCTQSQYNTLEANDQLVDNCYYFIVDDSSYEDIEDDVEEMQETTATHTTQIGTLQSKVALLENQVGPLQNDVLGLQTDVLRIKQAQVTGSFAWDSTTRQGEAELSAILAIDPFAEFYGEIGSEGIYNKLIPGKDTQGNGYQTLFYVIYNGTDTIVKKWNYSTVYYRYFKSFTA